LLDGPQDPIIEIDDSAPRNRRHRPSPPVSPGDTALARLRRVDKDTYIARVIRKLGDAGGQIIGVVRERNDGLWLIPADRRERYDYQLEKDTKAAHGDLLICEKLPGPRMGAKRAKLKENIGAAGRPARLFAYLDCRAGFADCFPRCGDRRSRGRDRSRCDRARRPDRPALYHH
jgi:ribonuclease R